MKALTMFYLEDCGYCAKARKALEELYEENPAYREVPIHLFMSYEDIRDEVRRVLDYSLSTPEAAAEP